MDNIENTITRQIALINQQISDLNAERGVLERLLLKARRENIAHRDVVRKNSINRILVEDNILNTLKNSSKPMTARDLYAVVRHVVYNLKSTTFRSHLRRMKDRGIIQQRSGYGGQWSLPED